jgi:GxxExxY protein
MQDLNLITDQIIGSAIEVHRILGPGLLESIYEKALAFELEKRNLSVQNQLEIPIVYKGQSFGVHRLDLLVENLIIVELKAVDRFDPVHQAQLLGYLKLANKPLGLLINFNVSILKNGIKRIVL